MLNYKLIILFTLVYSSWCNGQIGNYFTQINKITRDISDQLSKNPVVDFVTSANGNALANVVDVFTQVPLALARSVSPIHIPQLISDGNTVEYADSFVADYQAAGSNEDANLNIEELVVKYGHPIEKHTVTTDDGYVLTLFRIPNNASAVFLMHGLLGSADDYVIAGPDSGLAYLLANKGYDVWMGNARGNKHSRRHTYLRTTDAAFWDFSFHEIGVHDLPAMIDYVLMETNQTSVKYVGHSQGTTSFFAMASELPEYNEKISLMIALSPVAFMSHAKSPIVRLLAPGTNVLGGIFNSIGLYEFLPDNNIMQMMKLATCGTGTLAEIFCNNVMFLMIGFDLGQANVTNLPVLFGHMPAGASTKQFIHYGQEVISGDFQKFDYGATENLKRYGVETPPSYDLDKISVPVALFYSDEDWLAHPSDVGKLYYKLNNVVDVYKVPYKQFNHLDYMIARDVKTLIFDRLYKLLLSF